MTAATVAPSADRGGRAGLGAAVAAAVLVIVAAGGFGAVLEPGALAATVGPGAFLGLVGGLVAQRRATPVASRVLVAVGLVVVATAVGARSILALGDVVDGPRRLVTGGVPADADSAVRASIAGIVCLAVIVGVALARRSRGAWSVAVAVVVLLGSTATGLADDLPDQSLAAVFGAALLGFSSIGGRHRPSARTTGAPGGRLRRTLAAVAMAAVALVAGIGGQAAITGDHPTDRFTLRSVVSEPPQTVEVRNPLDVAAGLRRRPDDVFGTARLDRSQDRLPIATFVAYDGDTFVFAPDAQPLSDRARGGAGAGPVVTQDLELGSWPFAPLPHVGELLRVADSPAGTTDGLAVDERTGRALVFGPGEGTWRIASLLGPGTAPADARFATDDEADRARAPTALPVSFDPLLAVAEELRTSGDVALVDALAAQFRDLVRIVEPGEPAAAGHGVTTLGCVVDGVVPSAAEGGRATACRRAGTPTQVASAFVLTARQLDVPVRLVVGFEFPGTALTPRALRASELTAWAEVRYADVGWVPVDPVSDQLVSGAPPEAEDDDPGAPDPESTPPEPEGGSTTDDGVLSVTGAARRGPVIVGLLLVAVAVLLVLPAVLRRRRVARRRSGGAADSVRGAWWEMWDRLAERGTPAPPAAPVGAVVRLHAGGVDDDGDLAALVNRVAFGGSAASPSEAARIWSAVSAHEAGWRRSATRTRRLRRYVRYQTSRAARRSLVTRPGSSPPSRR